MAMPQGCYLAKGAKRPSHTTNMLTSSDHNLKIIADMKFFDGGTNYLISTLWDQIFIFKAVNTNRGLQTNGNLKNDKVLQILIPATIQ